MGSELQRRRVLILLLATCETALDELRIGGEPDSELVIDLQRVIERTRSELAVP
jgi:hypothetical protein